MNGQTETQTEVADRQTAADTQETGAAITQRRPLEFEPANMDDAWRLAGMFARSGIIPDALIGKPNDILVTMLAGRELGLSPVQSIRLVYVVKGKPYIATQLKLARVKNSPECVYIRCIETTDQRATFETERRGEGVTRVTFTIEDAKRAGLAGRPVTPGKESNWDKYPAVMLRWRAASQLCDLVYSDVVNGVGSTEELEDMRRAEEANRVYAPHPPQATTQPEKVVGSGSTVRQQATSPSPAPKPTPPGAQQDPAPSQPPTPTQPSAPAPEPQTSDDEPPADVQLPTGKSAPEPAPTASGPAVSEGTKALKEQMWAAVEAKDGTTLVRLSAKVRDAPAEEQPELREFYAHSKEQLKAKSSK